MKRQLLFMIQNSLSLLCFAQTGEWTWMHGSNMQFQQPVYGPAGIFSPDITPGARYESGAFTDSLNIFWIFGGSTGTYRNDLWKYDPSVNQWAFMKGDTIPTTVGVYGTQGVPSPLNNPGGRYTFPSWHHTGKYLWLFGGNNGVIRNDLWRYNIETNEWTWMKGSNSSATAYGVYGIQGVPDPANTPGARYETTCTWVDADDNLWLFGGTGRAASGNAGLLNDLWKYDVATNNWTWVSGDSTTDVPGVYGIKGVADSSNTPGGRMAWCHWKDLDGNFWIFGGGAASQHLNDLWKYDFLYNEWTWMSGSNVTVATGDGEYFSAKCVSDSLNVPGRRLENKACWIDSCNNLWMFGGFNTFGDLWKYDISANEWIWVHGDSLLSTSPVYGVQGVPDSQNKPGGRCGSPSWQLPDGSMWLYSGLNVADDVWRFTPDLNCGGCALNNYNPVTAFVASATNICEKFCIDFINQSWNNPTSSIWQFPGGIPSSSTEEHPAGICYLIPGTYDVTLITTNALGSDTLTLLDYVTVYSTPPFPAITQSGYTLSSTPAAGYQWEFNSIDIPGATNQSYTVIQTGFYTVVISDSNGCVNSTTVFVEVTGIEELFSEENISVYPNPSTGRLIVQLSNCSIAGSFSIEIQNMMGQQIFSSLEEISASEWKREIELNNAANGVYYIEIGCENLFNRSKFLLCR